MRRRIPITLLLPAAALLCCAQAHIPGHDENKIQVLLMTGYNSTPQHKWRENSQELRRILEEVGKFEVRINEEPRGITAEVVGGYDVLLLDYSDYTPSLAPTWPPETRAAYLEFLKSGKGVVAFHAACGSFPEWEEYRSTLGILDYRAIGHGPYHTFSVNVRRRDHPAVKSLPGRFLQWGEIYNGVKLLPETEVLATAYDRVDNCTPDRKHCGSGKDEPIVWGYHYSRGRVLVIVLGHDMKSIQSQEFRRLLVDGTEWVAARGAGEVGPR